MAPNRAEVSEHVESLRADYSSLPLTDRPNFPLNSVVSVGDASNTRTEMPATTSEFARKLWQFLDLWGLRSLVTWDFPEPQEPLLPNLLPEGPARPAHGIHLFIPIHYPMKGNDDLLGQVREYQRQKAIELGLPPGFGSISHHAQYAKIFQLIHLDLAVRSRFRDRPPRGFVSALEAAATFCTGIESQESVRRLWKWIRACRRGDRRTIPQLRD
jgi:hypothetical protein